MVKKIFRKNRKGLAFFVLLDLWSIIAVVGFLILLLIYINFTEKVQEKDIANKIVGSNFPHYIISSFESEVVDFKGCAGIPENITRTEFLVWLDYNKALLDQTGKFGSCMMAFRSSLLIQELIIGGDCEFSVILQGEELNDACYKDKAYDDKEVHFSYEIPAENDNIKITVCFMSNKTG